MTVNYNMHHIIIHQIYLQFWLFIEQNTAGEWHSACVIKQRELVNRLIILLLPINNTKYRTKNDVWITYQTMHLWKPSRPNSYLWISVQYLVPTTSTCTLWFFKEIDTMHMHIKRILYLHVPPRVVMIDNEFQSLTLFLHVTNFQGRIEIAKTQGNMYMYTRQNYPMFSIPFII